jgi:predicted component of viral defense system (DUF524 family)
VEEIAVQLGVSPAIDLCYSDERRLEWQASARFGEVGTLVYNQYQLSYSVPLRPDFTWKLHGQAGVVFDAKFRLERLNIAGEDDDSPETIAKRADLYKMHTYRDALGARAAVAVYPGMESVFYGLARQRRSGFTLRDLLLGDLVGIGAFHASPDRRFGEE